MADDLNTALKYRKNGKMRISVADRMLAKKLREKAAVIRTLVVALEELKDGRSR